MEVFVHAPEQFENLCVLARTLEVFGFQRCYVFDPRRIVRDRYGKSYGQKLRTVSAGAFDKIRWLRIESDPVSYLRAYAGRRVATVPRKGATSLHQFRFRESDLLVIGSEARGLDEHVLAECDEQITIPQQGVTESLNVAVASGIILCEFKRQEALGLLADNADCRQTRES
jgi:tRNA G18 (ribose-2'-O)-methylase SpoU